MGRKSLVSEFNLDKEKGEDVEVSGEFYNNAFWGSCPDHSFDIQAMLLTAFT